MTDPLCPCNRLANTMFTARRFKLRTEKMVPFPTEAIIFMQVKIFPSSPVSWKIEPDELYPRSKFFYYSEKNNASFFMLWFVEDIFLIN